MPKYTQTIRFERELVINAKDAREANEKLEALIHDIEWGSDVRNEGYYDFEECPKCKGNCTIGDDEQNCDRCNGEGSVPFTAEQTA